ncbi:MAG: L-histidine N(alpha)-methyltransferase [Chloroflexi bacterium]|nr:L-histidine N(alpha)-methyltransferase [Chloroflexota bacterium]
MTTDRLSITVHTQADDERLSAVDDIVRGFTSEPKTLDPKFLYHGEGSELFDEITRLEEYYPTRVERSLLERHGAEIVQSVQPYDIVELGPGNSAKSGLLIGPALAAGTLRRYIPFDISEEALREGGVSLMAAYPELREIAAVVGDFWRHLREVPPTEGTRLAALLGSTIGNLHPDEQCDFLWEIREGMLGPGDAFLVGADLVKETSVIEAAYNDAKGVTAQFNLNSLRAVNDLLGLDIDTGLFRHRAFFNTEHSRIEMHLEALADVSFTLSPSGVTVDIRAGETIWTESSYKFTKEAFEGTLAAAGFANVEWYTDPDDMFALALARV